MCTSSLCLCVRACMQLRSSYHLCRRENGRKTLFTSLGLSFPSPSLLSLPPPPPSLIPVFIYHFAGMVLAGCECAKAAHPFAALVSNFCCDIADCPIANSYPNGKCKNVEAATICERVYAAMSGYVCVCV